MLQTTSTERCAAGGDRPRSGGSGKMRPMSSDASVQIGHSRIAPPF